MVGGTVGQVVRSNHPGFAAGDFVLGYWGWQEYGLSDGAGVRKLDPALGPLSYALGVLGMPGMTAYVALLDIGRPQPGETVVVSAASGPWARSSARSPRSRAAGPSGSPAATRSAATSSTSWASTPASTTRRRTSTGRSKDACPAGIDVYYDNVGGPVLEAVLRRINRGARIPLVGLIAQYNAAEPPPGPNLMPLLIQRALIQGFIVSDHPGREADFLRDVSGWLKEGKIRYKEDVVEGLENAPRAFLGLFRGENFGKLLVRVGDDPTRARG